MCSSCPSFWLPLSMQCPRARGPGRAAGFPRRCIPFHVAPGSGGKAVSGGHRSGDRSSGKRGATARSERRRLVQWALRGLPQSRWPGNRFHLNPQFHQPRPAGQADRSADCRNDPQRPIRAHARVRHTTRRPADLRSHRLDSGVFFAVQHRFGREGNDRFGNL
jgi:hypothetical protein